MTQQFDAVVLGGGAAGLMCALEAGKRGRRVAVLERAERAGKKILISGGGRCNFTNIHCRPENFISANPHFAKSALARYTPLDFIALVEKHRIPYHEKTLGQLFCDRSSRDVMDMLEGECREAGSFCEDFNSRSLDDDGVCGAHGRGRISRPGASGCDRRVVNSENGCDRPGIRSGAAIRVSDSRASACAGAVYFRRRGPQPLLRSGGSLGGCGRLL
jgi:hypothetical protein